ncbi:MAG: sugar-binding domain-containing protein, partial [Chloroflexota bacterium]
MKQVGKKHIWIGLILSILILDGFIWLATVRVANAPSAEALRRQQAVTPTIPPSSVNANAIITPSQISLNGPWYHRQSGEETESFLDPDLDITVWDQIDIPQNWYLAGLNYHGMVWFGRHFVVEESYRDQSIQVHFAGVDYQTDVWLNGHYLGQHEGYFESFQFPIQNHLKYGETNTLLVRVNSPYEKIETNWPAQKQIIKGVFNHHPTRPGGLSKADGQAYSTGGIWDDVSLTIGNATTIDDIQIQISWPNQATFPHSAQLEVFIHVIHHADQPQEVTSSITLEPKNFIGKAITLPKQTHLFERGNTVITFTEMISQPQLWQTWEQGKPNLYNAQIILKQNNKVIDTQQRSFGFRLVEMDDKGIWHLNKMPIFLRGTHYVSNQWLAKSNRAWLERDLALMRQANLNTIRVHAHVEPPEFYDLADEQGFLVWQDFPLFAGYSDHPTFVDQAQAQFEAMVKQLYNHPSIIAWNVHTQSPWATPSEAASTQNKRLDDRLQRLGSTLDTGRVTFMETP